MDIFHLTSWADVVAFTIQNGYLLMFVAMLIEGPIITAAASFAVSLGYFGLAPIFLLSLLGDLVADVVYYALGYYSRVSVVEKWGHRFGLTQARVKHLEDLLNTHTIKTLIALKLTPVIPTPGLMIVGTLKIPLRKFVIICLAITLPKTILFMVVGYYFGAAYSKFAESFEQGQYAVLFVLLLIVVIYIIYNKLAARVGEKIEKI